MTLKFYANVAKGLKLKARKFWGLVPMFVEVTGEKLVGEVFLLPVPILDRVKTNNPIIWKPVNLSKIQITWLVST